MRNVRGDFMDTIQIRKISSADADAVSAICSGEMGYPCQAASVADKIRQLDPKREAVFVALANDTAVGFVHVEKYDVLYFETMANILGLAVSAQYQRQGIGKRLIHAAEEWAAAHSIKAMRLNSGMTRTDAHGFYRHLGYDSEKEQIRFVKYLP